MKMYDILENVHSISAEQAFGIYDVKDQGVCTEDEFKRIVKIFFDDLDENEINLLVRITDKTAQQEIAYRSVCRFLTKRFIRTFKN
jgi:Ca2+-binding EF-hand superfamily protein